MCILMCLGLSLTVLFAHQFFVPFFSSLFWNIVWFSFISSIGVLALIFCCVLRWLLWGQADWLWVAAQASCSQVNDWQDDWPAFFTQHRLQAQLDLIEKDYGDREARELWSRLQVGTADASPGKRLCSHVPPHAWGFLQSRDQGVLSPGVQLVQLGTRVTPLAPQCSSQCWVTRCLIWGFSQVPGSWLFPPLSHVSLLVTLGYSSHFLLCQSMNVSTSVKM